MKMAWTGFGGSWHDGVHSGGDDSGSIGGGGIKLDGKGNPVGTRAPNAAEIAAEWNSYGAIQITPDMVSNISYYDYGTYQADIAGQYHTVTVDGVSKTSTTCGGFTGIATPISNGGKGEKGGMSNWNDAANSIRSGVIPPNFTLQGDKIGIMTPIYRDGGVGHGTQIDVFTGKYKFVEVPSLTDAYQTGVKEREDTKAAAKITADFYKEIGEKAGARQAAIAKELAAAAKGKKLRSASEALAAYEKYKNVLSAKYSVADRQAIARALASVNRDTAAKNLHLFGKAAGFVGVSMDMYDLTVELKKSIETDNYRGFALKAASMLAAYDAGLITAWAFSIMLGSPLGILGYAIIMASVSALIDEKLLGNVMNYITTGR
ncbi:hypothetical protein CIW61_01235 [Enterobacter cloacae]|nr:hypothetical protein CIW61_01235 [Enterobacter cloacae]